MAAVNVDSVQAAVGQRLAVPDGVGDLGGNLAHVGDGAVRGDAVGAAVDPADGLQDRLLLGRGEAGFGAEGVVAVEVGVQQAWHVGLAGVHVGDHPGLCLGLGEMLYFAVPKGAKTRVVDMPSSVAEELKRHVAAFPPMEVELPWGEAGSGRAAEEVLPFVVGGRTEGRLPRAAARLRVDHAGSGGAGGDVGAIARALLSGCHAGPAAVAGWRGIRPRATQPAVVGPPGKPPISAVPWPQLS